MNPFKPVHNFRPESKVFRAALDVDKTYCPNCNKEVYKQNSNQIVYFCGKGCRNAYREKVEHIR